MTNTESKPHDWANCAHCYHESDGPDSAGCWCPDCLYADDSADPPDGYEDVYRAHVRMSGMAPPHNNGSECDCQFATGEMTLVIDPGSPAQDAYDDAYAEYLALMRPVWQELGAPEYEGDNESFRAVMQFDAKMRILTKPPLLIDSFVEAEAYIDARSTVLKPDSE